MRVIRDHGKGVAALLLIIAGVYLAFGLPAALIVAGALLLVDRLT
jgi:hypothetical protein